MEGGPALTERNTTIGLASQGEICQKPLSDAPMEPAVMPSVFTQWLEMGAPRSMDLGSRATFKEGLT